MMAKRNPFPVLKFISDASVVLAAIVFTVCFIAVIYCAFNNLREYGILIGCIAIPVSLGLNIFGELLGLLLSIERNGRLLLDQSQQAQLSNEDAMEEQGESANVNIVIACPSCGTGFSTSREVLGKNVKCGKCGLKFTASDGPF